MKHTKVAIIGAGAVGSTVAYSLMLKNLVAEIVLIDIDVKRCSGEVLDLTDCLALSYASSLHQGEYKDALDADIVIVTAGKAQRPGQTRIELIEANKKMICSVLGELKGLNKQAILIIVSNPLDLLTYYAHTHFDFPKSHMFGMGTFLDSYRLKQLLSYQTGVAAESIEGYVLGEHGDSEVVAWSTTRIAGASVEQFGVTDSLKEKIAQAAKSKAYEIIATKGATYYGIALCVATVCEKIIYNTREAVPVSWYHEEYGVCFSLPVLLSQNGVEKVIDLDLTDKERESLQHSAQTLKGYFSLLT